MISGEERAYATTPKPKAISKAKASARSMPRIEAMLLTTALDERKELRNSVHFNQISVVKWFNENLAFRSLVFGFLSLVLKLSS